MNKNDRPNKWRNRYRRWLLRLAGSPEEAQCRPLRLWPRRRTDRLSLPVSPESIADFFKRTEWEYACLFLIESRDDAVRLLAAKETRDPAEVARLQQEVGTLTTLIGDDKTVMSLKDYMVDEVLEFLRAQEEEKNA